MARKRKLAKKRMKRNLLKRYKQTAKVPVVVESPKKIKEHLLYEGKYEVENKGYQSQLNAVYGKGMVNPIEQFISPQATLIHFCNECSKKFYAKPSYLLKGTHDCKATGGMGSSLNYTKKQNNKVSNNVNGAELVKSLDRMILSGVKPHLITSKIGVAIQIVKWYKEKYHAEVK